MPVPVYSKSTPLFLFRTPICCLFLKLKWLWLFIFLTIGLIGTAQSADTLIRLQKSYPDCIQEISSNYILWKDGSRMLVRGHFSFLDRLFSSFYHINLALGSISTEDVLRDQYEPFFKKMYGSSAAEVKKKLVTIYWMPHVFGKRYPIKVTLINGIAQKLQRISAALEKLPPTYYKYLAHPAGGFYWRNVAGESYLSAHSFGIAIDINSFYSNYWLWDWQRAKRPFAELAKLNHNRIPMQIVKIFEKEGFFWGGRWYFYDTMHFEYRPELLIT